jgi:ribosomal-protein-alanine N-acetyltransferase
VSLPDMALGLDGLRLRAWRADDAAALAAIADDVEVWRHMSELFPHPYTLDVARSWVERGHVDFGGENCAIECGGQLAGGAGLHPGTGQFRCNVEIGYWLGRGFWGRGIATRVAARLTALAFEQPEVTRVFAGVHADNPRSMQVLAKCGFEREGVQRLSAIKAGRAIDRVIYARYRDAAVGAG